MANEGLTIAVHGETQAVNALKKVEGGFKADAHAATQAAHASDKFNRSMAHGAHQAHAHGIAGSREASTFARVAFGGAAGGLVRHAGHMGLGLGAGLVAFEGMKTAMEASEMAAERLTEHYVKQMEAVERTEEHERARGKEAIATIRGLSNMEKAIASAGGGANAEAIKQVAELDKKILARKHLMMGVDSVSQAKAEAYALDHPRMAEEREQNRKLRHKLDVLNEGARNEEGLSSAIGAPDFAKNNVLQSAGFIGQLLQAWTYAEKVTKPGYAADALHGIPAIGAALSPGSKTTQAAEKGQDITEEMMVNTREAMQSDRKRMAEVDEASKKLAESLNAAADAAQRLGSSLPTE